MYCVPGLFDASDDKDTSSRVLKKTFMFGLATEKCQMDHIYASLLSFSDLVSLLSLCVETSSVNPD